MGKKGENEGKEKKKDKKKDQIWIFFVIKRGDEIKEKKWEKKQRRIQKGWGGGEANPN